MAIKIIIPERPERAQNPGKGAATTAQNKACPNALPLASSAQQGKEGAVRPAAYAKRKAEAKSGGELTKILGELDSLIGLKEVKALIHEVYAYGEVQKLRAKEDLAADSTVLHAIFKGNPGSGKTTVARLLAKLYKEMGVLEKGHLIEVERADLVGEYIGHTAQKTKEHINKALGGVLFIDEAYSLCRGGEKDFGREAIDTLVKAMEDHKNSFILILAGYNKEMIQFLASNPGLNSRFPLHIQFPDYDLNELMDISALMFKERQYMPNPEAQLRLRAYLAKILEIMPECHGNARTVRNIVEAAMRAQAVRLMRERKAIYAREELEMISAWDINQAVMKTAIAMKSQPELNNIHALSS